MALKDHIFTDSPTKAIYSLGYGQRHTFTLTMPEAAFTAADVLFQPVELTDAVLRNGGRALVHQITVVDDFEQSPQISFIFLRSAITIAAVNAAMDIGGATEVSEIISQIPSGDFSDFTDWGGVVVSQYPSATGSGGRVIQSGANTRSIWVAGMVDNAPDYAANDTVIIHIDTILL